MAGGRGHRLDGLKARRILAGLSIAELARRANVSDWTIQTLEDGGNCDPHVSQRILDALVSVKAITSNSQANPTVVTCTGHGYQTGDVVVIAGVAGSNADVNGTRTVTRVNDNTFTVPVNCSTAGGTGGTATPTLASLSQAAL